MSEEPTSGPNIGLLLTMLVGGAAAGGAAVFFLAPAQETLESKPEATKASTKAVGPVADLEPFVVNLHGELPDMHYLKSSLTVELLSEELRPAFEASTPAVRNDVLVYLSGLTFDDIQGRQNMARMRADLKGRLTDTVGKGVIKNVFITELVIQ